MKVDSYTKQEATMKKALLLFIVLVLMIPVVSNAQHEVWTDSIKVTLDGTDSVSVYQKFYSRQRTVLDTISFPYLYGVFNGYNDGTVVIKTDSVGASMDTDSLQWKIEKMAHDGRTIDSTASTFYVTSTGDLTTTVTWLNWIPSNSSSDDYHLWADLVGSMIDPHCLGLKHTFTFRNSAAGAGTAGVLKLTLFTYMVRTVR